MSAPNIVPNVVGLAYFDAQLTILGAAMLIAPPTFVLGSALSLTADTTAITADSSLFRADKAIRQFLPQYVLSQSLPPGMVVAPQTPLSITVVGFPVYGQNRAVP